MTLRTQTARTAAAIGMVAAIGVVAPSSAQAAKGYDRCPANRFCLFTGVNGTGVIGIFASGDVNLAAAPGPSGLNDNTKSYLNNRGTAWNVYVGTKYNGRFNTFPAGEGDDLIGVFRDGISSLKPR